MTFLTRLQQFCGVAFPRKFGDDSVRSRSPVLTADAAYTPILWFLANPLAAANKIPIMRVAAMPRSLADAQLRQCVSALAGETCKKWSGFGQTRLMGFEGYATISSYLNGRDSDVA